MLRGAHATDEYATVPVGLRDVRQAVSKVDDGAYIAYTIPSIESAIILK